MTPIGKSTFFADGGEWLVHGPDVVVRVGSGLACEPESQFRTWYCPRDDAQVSIPVTCKNARLCPACSKRWAFKEARKAAWRLRQVAKRKVGNALSPRHVVVSFPANVDPLTEWGYNMAMRRAWATLKEMGAHGGVGIYHPWRHKPKGTTVAGSFWSLGPHTHWLVWGFFEACRRGSAFVRVIHQKGQKDVVATLGYLLDHCGVQERKHAVRYYGIASYGLCPGIPKPPSDAKVPLCPVCGGAMEPLEGIADYTSWANPEMVGTLSWGRALAVALRSDVP